MFGMTADEIMKRDSDLAILPLGSTEQHGPHLPVTTDWRIAGALGEAVAERTGGFLVPPLPISTCTEQMGKKGTVFMHSDTFYAMFRDIALCLKAQGFRKICVLQCHGGIFVLTPVVREMNAEFNPELMIAKVDVCDLFPQLFAEHLLETPELHAGECETSLMLHIDPEHVHMDRAVDFVPSVPRPYLTYGSVFRASPSGVWGTPSKATAEKGARLLERMADLSAKAADDAFAYMEKKKRFNRCDF